MNAEWNIFNRGLPASDVSAKEGEATTKEGMLTMNDAKQYWQTILSGNKPAVMQAAAPAVAQVNEGADAERRQQAEMGTSRGGGVNATNQAAESNRTAEIDNIIAGLQPKAAENVAKVGQAETAVGHQQMGEALVSLGLSKEVADEIVNSSIQSRPISMQANAAVRQQWSNMLAALGL